MTGYPEPPAVGSETDTLLGSLERQRATFAYKCADLTRRAAERVTIGASTMTLGGLLKHLAYMEDLNFTWDLAGRELPQPWASIAPRRAGARRCGARRPRTTRRRSTGCGTTPSTGRAPSCTRCWPTAGPTPPTSRVGRRPAVRRLLVDFIEEYGRHTGHADLLREAVDGRVGEDPPGSAPPVLARVRPHGWA